MRQGPEALEAFHAQQLANFRYRTIENLDYINRQNERRTRLYNERFPNFFIDDEINVESESTLTAETPNATPNAAKYLSELQPIVVNDLPEDGRICAICKESYNSEEDPEQACKVGPCGHILGRTCLSTWIMPAGSRPNTTCPLCRAVLFEADIPNTAIEYDGGFLLGAIPIGELPNDEDRPEEDEALPSDLPPDLPTGEDEDPYEDEQMVNGRYASGMLDPAISDAMSSALGVIAWADMEANFLERAEAEIAQPSYMLSDYVLAYFRIFVRRRYLGSSATISAGSSVRRIMGQLYVRLREDMERTAMPIVWTENGPPLSLLLDPATIPLIETALERLVDIELQRYAAER